MEFCLVSNKSKKYNYAQNLFHNNKIRKFISLREPYSGSFFPQKNELVKLYL